MNYIQVSCQNPSGDLLTITSRAECIDHRLPTGPEALGLILSMGVHACVCVPACVCKHKDALLADSSVRLPFSLVERLGNCPTCKWLDYPALSCISFLDTYNTMKSSGFMPLGYFDLAEKHLYRIWNHQQEASFLPKGRRASVNCQADRRHFLMQIISRLDTHEG